MKISEKKDFPLKFKIKQNYTLELPTIHFFHISSFCTQKNFISFSKSYLILFADYCSHEIKYDSNENFIWKIIKFININWSEGIFFTDKDFNFVQIENERFFLQNVNSTIFDVEFFLSVFIFYHRMCGIRWNEWYKFNNFSKN